jgi:hypothetical protein
MNNNEPFKLRQDHIKFDGVLCIALPVSINRNVCIQQTIHACIRSPLSSLRSKGSVFYRFEKTQRQLRQCGTAVNSMVIIASIVPILADQL